MATTRIVVLIHLVIRRCNNGLVCSPATDSSDDRYAHLKFAMLRLRTTQLTEIDCKDTGRSVLIDSESYSVICSSGYERRKAPEKVHAALIDAAARLIAERGLSRLTIDAVAKAAGVTKGGLFHHFASKDDLIQGVLGAMVDSANRTIAATMATDPEPHGSFTRAYLESVFVDTAVTDHASGRTLCLAMLADPKLHEFWFDWVKGQVATHAATDDNPACGLVRLAADGIWLNSLRHGAAPPAVSRDIHTTLIGLTRPDP